MFLTVKWLFDGCEMVAHENSKQKSSVTNGVRLLYGATKQSKYGRRYRDLYQQYMQETGGQSPELCKQAASLVVQRERMDADVVNDKPIDQFHFVRIANALTRTLCAMKRLSAPPPRKYVRKHRPPQPDDHKQRAAREEALLT